MILELLGNLLTPCSRAWRTVGYLRGQNGIKVRYRQCRQKWTPHLERTKQAIRDAVSLCPQRRKAVILGSGLLLDIPLADLSRTFREVVLVDVVHPLSVFCRAKRYRNVRLVRADAEVDFVASVNLLSQLPHLPTAYFGKNAPRPERETDAFARQLMESHLDDLQRLPGVVSLITDVEKQQVDRNGKVIQQFDLLYGVRPPRHDDDWLWAHVPINHLSPEWAYQRRVIAVRNVKSRVH